MKMAPAKFSNGRQVEAGGGASKLHQVVPSFDGWLLGLFALSTAIALAVNVRPPPGLHMEAYFLALTGLFFGGVTQVAASVWAADDARRLAAGRKLVYKSLVMPLLVAIGRQLGGFASSMSL